MAWLAIDKDGTEIACATKPFRADFLADKFIEFEYLKGKWVTVAFNQFDCFPVRNCLEFPKGSIAKLIGRELTWEDEPVEL